MSEDLPDPSSKLEPERRRVPLERKISLKFKEFRGFITEYSENISLGGMFIRTASPKPPGTVFDFEFTLADDFKLVQGIGEVVWIRQTDEGSVRPSGMGVRFLDLSPESRKLIQRMVDEHIARGGRPFELEPQDFPPPPVRTPTGATSPARSATPPVFHPTATPVAPLPPRERPPASPRAAGPAPAPPPLPAPPLAPPEEPLELGELEQIDLPLPELDLGEGLEALPRVAPASWEPESLEGFPLVEDAEDAAAMEDTAVAGDAGASGAAAGAAAGAGAGAAMPRPPEEQAPAGEPTPLDERPDEAVATTWRSPAAPQSSRRRQHDAELDEVARALGQLVPGPIGPSTSEMTVRLPVAPAASVAAASMASRPPAAADTAVEPAPVAPPPILGYRPSRAPRAEPRRRSRAVPLVLVLLLLVVGAAALLYFRYPSLLPAWARPPGTATAGGTRPATAAPRVTGQQPRPEPSAGAPATATAAAPAAPAMAAASPATSRAAAPIAPPATAPHAAPPPAASTPSVARAPLPAPMPPGVPAVRAPAPGAHFSAVEEIWGQRTAAGTVITIVGNGPVPPDAFSHFRLEGDNPREVVRVRGVDASFRRSLIPVGTTEVKEIRVGFHGQGGSGELHVVLDLASPRVKLVRLSASDNRIEIQLAQ